jgi:flagellar hook-associated protein 1 FlgK
VFAEEGKNTFTGVEYFRNLLDSFGKTFADTLNGIFNKENHTYTDFPGMGEQVLFNYNHKYSMTVGGDEVNASYIYSVQAAGNVTDRHGFGASTLPTSTDTLLMFTNGNGSAVDMSSDAAVKNYMSSLADPSAFNMADLQAALDAVYSAPGTQITVSAVTGGDLIASGTVDGVADSLVVSDFWQNNPNFIAEPNGYDIHTALDNSYINKIIGAFTNKLSYRGDTTLYSFEEYISHYGNELGNRIQYETKITGTTEVMLLSVTDSRDSVMGTSIDEEGINMMNYQKWYNAIARMTTTLDEALDRLINSTGRVGL